MKIIAILAMDEHCLIGSNQSLPWHIPEDMKRFREFTTGHTVLMGKNTYFSLPEKVRPLPNRRNIVITRSHIPQVETFSDIHECVEFLRKEGLQELYLIWWASIYNQFFERWLVDKVELTLVSGVHDGDIFIRDFRSEFITIDSQEFSQWVFQTLIRNS
jgi:dihydrofolate reductase